MGDEGARPQAGAAVHRRHPQLVEPAALANLQAGNIDLFNNFAPKSAIKGKFKTFYNKAPYHLGANTTWLFPNTTKKPLNDPQFRRALAFSINMNQILDKAYQGLVDKASPTGLLPIWNKWVDKKAVAKYGFSYNPTQGEGDPRRCRLQGHGRGRLRREQGRVEDLDMHDPVPERMVGLDDVDPGRRRKCESRRHQGHAGLPRLRNDGRRSRPRERTTWYSPTTGRFATRRGRITSTSSNCRSWTTRRP